VCLNPKLFHQAVFQDAAKQWSLLTTSLYKDLITHIKRVIWLVGSHFCIIVGALKLSYRFQSFTSSECLASCRASHGYNACSTGKTFGKLLHINHAARWFLFALTCLIGSTSSSHFTRCLDMVCCPNYQNLIKPTLRGLLLWTRLNQTITIEFERSVSTQ
jgi:hypothetical protein